MSPVSRRRVTKPVYVGGVKIGGGAPVVVQSMTSCDTRDVRATVAQILRLEEAGCEIVRVAVPDEEAAAALREIKPLIHIPLIADIHFRHRLALLAMRHGADGIRINPGNLSPDAIRRIVKTARENGKVIRIGINADPSRRRYLPATGGRRRGLWWRAPLRTSAFLKRWVLTPSNSP